MKKVFIFSTGLFWLFVLITWAESRKTVDKTEETKVVAEKQYDFIEIAKHSAPNDCWMVIDGVVHDITAYLPDHPSNPKIIVPWCGKEASEAYRTKTKGRKHSAEADTLLIKYRIGVVRN